MKFILGFPNLVSNRFRAMIISRGGPPSLYSPLYKYLHAGTPQQPEQTRSLNRIRLCIMQGKKGKAWGDCKLLPDIRYFQHAHFVPIVGEGKRRTLIASW